MIATSSHLIDPSTPSYYNITAEICKIYIHYSYYAYLIYQVLSILPYSLQEKLKKQPFPHDGLLLK